MEHLLFKSWGLLSFEEQNQLKEALRDDFEMYREDGTEEEFEDYCARYNDDQLNDDFVGEHSNLVYSVLNNNEFELQGEIGRWDGKRGIVPLKFDSLKDAIMRVLKDRDCYYYYIYEDENKDLRMRSYHHDGVNNFLFKKITKEGLVPVNFAYEVFGYTGE